MQAVLVALALFSLSAPQPSWAQVNASHYLNTQQLHPDYVVYWTVANNQLRLGVEASVSGQTGWLGFGISEMGRMKGSDIVFYESATNTLTDSWADGESVPKKDECQDWTLLAGGIVGGKIYFEASRALAPTDTQDLSIISDSPPPKLPHRVIGAWGADGAIAYHGSQRFFTTLRFFKDGMVVDPLDALKADSTLSTNELKVSNYRIPSRRTTYYHKCVDFETEFNLDADTPLHVVGMEAIIPAATKANVHHIVVRGCSTCGDSDGGGMECGEGGGTSLWAWAPGTPNLVLPAAAGLRMLGPSSGGGFKTLTAEIHYDNPSGADDLDDNTAIKFYYTTTLRTHDVAVMNIGDPSLSVASIAELSPGWSHSAFECLPGYTNQFKDSEVTVISRGLHMHALGERMTVKIMRDGAVVREDTVDYWDFDAVGVFDPMSSNEGYTIKKGDSFKVDCYFYNPGTKAAIYGRGSDEEMCMDFIMYYPAQPLQSFPDSGADPQQCILWKEQTEDFGALGTSFYERNKDLNYGLYVGTRPITDLEASSDVIAIRNNIGRKFGVPCNAPAAPPTTISWPQTTEAPDEISSAPPPHHRMAWLLLLLPLFALMLSP